MSEAKRVRLAVAQTTVRDDPRSAELLRESGREIRGLMREAHAAGARIVHFPEGATCAPNKRIMSTVGPDQVGPADWDRVDWAVLRAELAETMALAATLKLWTVLGSVHRLTAPHRPHNSLYVISDRGTLATRYDERFLSSTKVSYLYSPGSAPLTFEVDGVRFGCLLGIEVHFPELFGEYERLGVDCVLFSTTGGPDDNGAFATEARAHAATNGYWISFAVPAQYGVVSPSGVIAPDGEWLVRGPEDGTSSVAVTDLDDSAANVEVALFKARPWRRTARAGVYDAYLVSDSRSEDRTAL